MRRLPYWGFFLGFLLLSASALVIAPFTGFNEELNRILLLTIGASRGQVGTYVLSFVFLSLYIFCSALVSTLRPEDHELLLS